MAGFDMCSLVVVAMAVFTVSPASVHAHGGSNINDTLLDIINGWSNYYNVSLSVAFTYHDPTTDAVTTAAAAGGYANHHGGGAVATINSLYPGGSVDKFFTAVSVMRLVERGLISLDAPVYKYIDPWNANHTPPRPTLLQLFGDARINIVTMRQLLQMRSGLHDYNDSEIFQWTVANPGQDYTPMMFLTNTNKSLLFSPGMGGAYTGNGYILAGMAIAAVTGAPTYDALNQRAAAGLPSTGDGPLFMGPGKCSTHPLVVHQYYYGNSPYGVEGTRLTTGAHVPSTTYARTRRDLPSQSSLWLLSSTSTAQMSPTAFDGASRALPKCGVKTGGTGWYKGVQVEGDIAKNFTLAGAEATAEGCCAAAGTVKGAQFWTYSAQDTGSGVCEVFSRSTGWHPSYHVSGMVDHPVALSDYHDLDDASCLNGWTMGNIAAAPRHVTTFYHAVASGSVISQVSLKEMMTYLNLTMGTEPPAGTPYGLGLVKSQDMRFPLADGAAVSPLCKPPRCLCGGTGKPCEFNASIWGHPGLDWASGFNVHVGFVPDFNVSFALGFNAYLGMNTSLSYIENTETNMYNGVACETWGAMVHALVPNFPAFAC